DIVGRMEGLYRWAGADSYEEAMHLTRRVAIGILKFSRRLKTKQQAREMFINLPEPSWLQQRLIFGAIRHTPRMLKNWTTQLLHTLEEELPKDKGGRPSIDLLTKIKVVGCVSRTMATGYSLEPSKR